MPPGKYHCGRGRALARRLGPARASRAPPGSPPRRRPRAITVSDSHEPDERAGMDGATTPWAGTDTAVCTVAPASVTAVIVRGRRRCAVVLVRTRKPGATPDAVGLPGAVPGGRLGIGRADQRARASAARRRAPACPGRRRRCRRRRPRATTRASTRHRRSRLWWAGVTTARLGERLGGDGRGGGRGRGPPWPADERAGQHAPRPPARAARPAGRRGTARARARPGPWRRRRTAPPSRTPAAARTVWPADASGRSSPPARSRRRGCRPAPRRWPGPPRESALSTGCQPATSAALG